MTAGAAAIDALLPQTQCTRCGYADCRAYAEAIASGEAPINRCPPGGASVIGRLAALLGCGAPALDPACGIEAPPRVARIDEARCIGCAKCLAPCPVDAIVGAPRHLHAVIIAECTGCELCLAPCPVDCIEMVPLASLGRPAVLPEADASRLRHRARGERLARREAERAGLLADRKRAARRAAAP